MVLEAIHKDGHPIWVQGSGTVIRDKAGKPTSVQTVFIDVTDKILLKKELEKTKNKYQHIIENLNGAITITDLNGNTSYTSPKIYDIRGYRPEDVIGQPGLNLFFESEHKSLLEYSQKLVSYTRQKIQQVYKGKHKDGSVRWINGTASLIKNKFGKPKGFVTIFFDVTSNLQIEKE